MPLYAVSAHRELHRLAIIRWSWLAAILLTLAGCSRPEPPLVIGTYPWPGYATLDIARTEGMLDPSAIRTLEFPSAREVMAAFRNGAIEAAGVTLDEALQLASGPDRLHIVLVFDFSAGADVLLARPEITGLRELRGKRVGVESGAEGEYILFRILEIAGLHMEDIRMVDLPLDKHLEAYRQGEVDAVITLDPVRIELLAAGARELFSTRIIASEIMDVLVVKQQALESRKRAIRQVVEGHFRVVDRIRRDPAQVAQAVPPRFGPPGEVLEAWRLIEFQGRTANEHLLSDGAIRDMIERVHAVLLRTYLQGRPVEWSALADDRFVRSAAP